MGPQDQNVFSFPGAPGAGVPGQTLMYGAPPPAATPQNRPDAGAPPGYAPPPAQGQVPPAGYAPDPSQPPGQVIPFPVQTQIIPQSLAAPQAMAVASVVHRVASMLPWYVWLAVGAGAATWWHRRSAR